MSLPSIGLSLPKNSFSDEEFFIREIALLIGTHAVSPYKFGKLLISFIAFELSLPSPI